MIYGESTLDTVHFTLSLQYGFAELYGNVCITENDIYWGHCSTAMAKTEYGLLPPTHTHRCTLFCVHKTCT